MEKLLLYSKGINYQSAVYIQNERKKKSANYTSDSGLTSRIKYCKN